MRAIETFGLVKQYKDKKAVKNLSFSVERGEIFSLLGTNGAGKTTAIKMLTTLIPPTEGGAKIEGLDLLADCMKIKEIVNVSPQETAIAPNLTVAENLSFMAGVYGIKNKDQKIAELVDRFGLAEVLRQKGKTLSGGWKRKLSIALALVNDPAVLFLDEPTLGLDVLARRELWRLIKDMRGRMTVVLTTHYMEEAEALSDRIAIMDKGRLIALGTPEELKQMAGREDFEEAFVALVEGGAKYEDA